MPAPCDPFLYSVYLCLSTYHALEIPFDNAEYRLVYRIFEKPTPKRVRVISFDVHDPAYEKAKERVMG